MWILHSKTLAAEFSPREREAIVHRLDLDLRFVALFVVVPLLLPPFWAKEKDIRR